MCKENAQLRPLPLHNPLIQLLTPNVVWIDVVLTAIHPCLQIMFKHLSTPRECYELDDMRMQTSFASFFVHSRDIRDAR